MKPLFYIAFLVLLCVQVRAQQTAILSKITGKVQDSATHQPVEYATVSVTDLVTKKIITGTVADLKGSFVIDGIPAGDYAITTDFIGYRKVVTNVYIPAGARKTIAINTIQLASAAQSLQAVTIVAKTPIVENKIDKIVYNAANDVAAQGGTALDVLKKVPQVSVDIDGNVEMQGSSGIRFLINGKPSSVFGNSLADALASIPASQIKSIEAITSPGARYDAQGTAGIINIILKDNKVKGINGNINLSAGTLLENGSANLNYRHNKWGVNAFFSGNEKLNAQTPSWQDRTTTDTLAHTQTHLLQNGNARFKRNGYQSGLGFDWSITPKDNITASFGYSHLYSNLTAITNLQQLTQDVSGTPVADVYSYRNANNQMSANSYDWSINYIKKFAKEGEELNFLYSASYGIPTSSYTQDQTYAGQNTPFAGSQSHNPGRDRETNLSLDYAYPASKDLVLETGVKTVIQTIYSDAEVSTLNTFTDQYAADPLQSYQLHYQRNIYAGYVSGNFALFHFLKVKAGVRVEHTDTKIDFPGTVIPSYNTVVPSIMLAHNFKKDQMLKIAYTHRIERPDYREINPFLNRSDPYNITTGNPVLKPEIGDNFEVGYSTSLGKGGNIYIALYERINHQDIKPYTQFFSAYQVGDSVYSNVSVASRINIGVEQNTGISISGSVPVWQQLTIRGNINAGNRRIVNKLDGTVINSLSCRLNTTASYQLPKDLILEGFCEYKSPFNNIQGKNPQMLSYTFAFRKQLLNKKLSFGVTATNPFNRYVRELTTIHTPVYTAYNFREVPYRSFGVSLSYKFGKLDFKKGKEDDNQPGNAAGMDN